MPKKTKNHQGSLTWLDNHKEMRTRFPHLFAFLEDNNEVREIRFKWRDDGTVLAIAKGYDSDGGPTICFGSGYDITLAFMSLDASIQGDNWRFDKPWPTPEK